MTVSQRYQDYIWDLVHISHAKFKEMHISWENVSLGKGTQENYTCCKKYMALWDEWFFKTMVMSGGWLTVMSQLSKYSHGLKGVAATAAQLPGESFPVTVWQNVLSLHCVTLTVAQCQTLQCSSVWHSVTLGVATCNTPIQKSFSPDWVWQSSPKTPRLVPGSHTQPTPLLNKW